jgi:hypothetical protein
MRPRSACLHYRSRGRLIFGLRCDQGRVMKSSTNPPNPRFGAVLWSWSHCQQVNPVSALGMSFRAAQPAQCIIFIPDAGCGVLGGAMAAKGTPSGPRNSSGPVLGGVWNQRDPLPEHGVVRELRCLGTPAANGESGLLRLRCVDAKQADSETTSVVVADIDGVAVDDLQDERSRRDWVRPHLGG